MIFLSLCTLVDVAVAHTCTSEPSAIFDQLLALSGTSAVTIIVVIGRLHSKRGQAAIGRCLASNDTHFSYRNRGEKSVSAIKVESIFSANLPFASDSSFTRFHSGSSWNDFQLAVAASRLGC